MRCATSSIYNVVLVGGLLDPGNRALADAIGERRALVVTDRNVDALYGDALRAYLATLRVPVALQVLDLSEAAKSMATVLDVCGAAQAHGLGRRDPLVAVGGGVCSDVVSLAATLIRRGIPYVCVPTTLVAQVDAGIALKCGVNFGGTKNYLGAFTPPSGVLVDPAFLRTVPVEHLRCGLAEIVKVALMLDADLFDRVAADGPELIRTGFTTPSPSATHFLARAVELMLDELSDNSYEDRTLERLVDFGHTFSGRLEELSDYRLLHGQAVAIDIALSTALAAELEVLSERDVDTVLDALLGLGLPIDTPLATMGSLLDAIAGCVQHRDGHVNLVVPTAIGSGAFIRTAEEIPDSALAAALARVRAAAARPAARPRQLQV
ncbi:MAG: sedoheptulose 7-phosphate cyclase [Gaiellales bacterium]